MSIIRRLQREIRSNPAKAAGLGVLLIVASYFWAPLLAQLFGLGDAAPPAPVAATPTPQSPAPAIIIAPLQKTAGGEVLAYDWRRYAKLIDEDPRMEGHAALPEGRDPFREDQPIVSAPEAPVAQTAEEPETEPAPITPADAGLALGSTLVSANKKVAEINGRSYTINDRVRTANAQLDVNFRVVEIHPRRVVLERLGKRYELKIPRPLVDAIETLTGSTDDPGENLTPPSGAAQPTSNGNREGG